MGGRGNDASIFFIRSTAEPHGSVEKKKPDPSGQAVRKREAASDQGYVRR